MLQLCDDSDCSTQTPSDTETLPPEFDHIVKFTEKNAVWF